MIAAPRRAMPPIALYLAILFTAIGNLYGNLNAYAAMAITARPGSVGLVFANPSTARLTIAKERAERHFIDFVELF